MKKPPGPQILNRWLIGAVGTIAALILAVVLTCRSTAALDEDASWVAHTLEVISNLHEVRGRMLRAQAIERSYVILGGETFPPQFAENVEAAKQSVAKIQELTSDNREQQARIPKLFKAIDELREVWIGKMNVRKEEGEEAAKRLVAAGSTTKPLGAFEDTLQAMLDSEQVLLPERSRTRERTYELAIFTEMLCGAAAVAGVIAFMILLSRHLREGEAAAVEIREQRERLRTTLASIGDAVISTDTSGRVTMMNAVAEALTGWPAVNAIGVPLTDVFNIVNEESRRPAEDPASRSIRDGVIVGLANHTLLIAKNGAEHPIDDSAAPIRCAQGQIVGCVLVFRDVTSRRKAEQELRDSDRRKDEFLATLSHELRNPLAPIQNALSIVKVAADDRQTFDQAINVMERQLNQMVRLVDDLLDVSRISRGKLELRKEPVELQQVLEQALEACQPLAKTAGIAVVQDLPRESVVLHADAVRLTQAFSNLVNNACKFTRGGGHVWLAARRDGGEAVVTVKDDGVGIAPDKLDAIFEMFSQVDRSLERTTSGLGIGLTLTKRLVELHGGHIAARSEGLGQGAEFVVRLPIAIEQPAKALPATHGPILPTDRLRILVVDDNRDSCESLAMLLKLLGHETHLGYNGEEAIDLATKLQPDLVLLDIGMPKLNGYDACRRIRKESHGQPMTVFALTGWGQDDDRRQSQEAGFDGHLVKPVDRARLAELLAGIRSRQG